MSEIHGATGSYVVNALDPDEFDEFEAHLAVCPTCRQEIVEFCETAAQLSLLADAPPPPVSLRDSILSSIAEVRPLPPLENVPRRALDNDEPTEVEQSEQVPPAPVMAAVPSPAVEAVTAKVVATEPVVDELALRREHRRTRALTLLVAAVTVVALAFGITTFSLMQGREAPTITAGADPSLLSAADARIVTQKLPSGAQVSFVVSKSQNRALFVSGNLPSPGPGKTYQLWTLRGKTAVPDALVGGGVDQQQWFHGPIDNSSGLAVTIEPAGGSQQPTGTITQVTI